MAISVRTLIVAHLVAVISVAPICAAEVFPEPSSVHMAGSVTINTGRPWASVSLWRCYTKEDFVFCNFAITALMDGANDYKYSPNILGTKLVDNFHIDHAVIRSRLLNGRGEPQEVVTLTKGEWVWLVQEYAGAAKDIDAAKVVFAISREAIDVPVEHPSSDPGPTVQTRKP